MCAMLSCVAPKELGISIARAHQFVEAYLGELEISTHWGSFLKRSRCLQKYFFASAYTWSWPTCGSMQH